MIHTGGIASDPNVVRLRSPGCVHTVSHGAPHGHGNRHPGRPRIGPTADNPPASCILRRWRTPGRGGVGRAPTADNAPIPAING